MTTECTRGPPRSRAKLTVPILLGLGLILGGEAWAQTVPLTQADLGRTRAAGVRFDAVFAETDGIEITTLVPELFVDALVAGNLKLFGSLSASVVSASAGGERNTELQVGSLGVGVRIRSERAPWVLAWSGGVTAGLAGSDDAAETGGAILLAAGGDFTDIFPEQITLEAGIQVRTGSESWMFQLDGGLEVTISTVDDARDRLVVTAPVLAGLGLSLMPGLWVLGELGGRLLIDAATSDPPSLAERLNLCARAGLRLDLSRLALSVHAAFPFTELARDLSTWTLGADALLRF